MWPQKVLQATPDGVSTYNVFVEALLLLAAHLALHMNSIVSIMLSALIKI